MSGPIKNSRGEADFMVMNKEKGTPLKKEGDGGKMSKAMKKYRDSCQSYFWQAIFEKEISYIARELKGCRNILSVGWGPAVIEKGLEEKGFDVTGLDVSEEALKGAPGSIRTLVGSAEKMEFESNSFDAVIYIASLQFIDNYEKAVWEAARVVKQDGKIIVMLLNPDSDFFEAKRKQTDSYVNKIKHLSLTSIEEAIRKRFGNLRTGYCIGVRGNQVFESRNPDLAAIYFIEGVKK